MNPLVINHNGNDGQRGQSGRAGGAGGGAGSNAGPSTAGTDAQPLNVTLSRDGDSIRVQWEDGDTVLGGYGAPNTSFTMSARGGHGGDGGSGGSGGSGTKGAPGADATYDFDGQNGLQGGPGGPGGNGSSGSDGGDGKNVVLTVQEANSDLLMLLHGAVDCSGGHAGQAGRGGFGGSGGRGGDGGRGGTITQQVPIQRIRNGIYYNTTTTRSRYRRAGYTGPMGPSGPSGASGNPGTRGQDGHFEIHLQHPDGRESVYTERYNLAITRATASTNRDDGVICPGDTVRVRLTVRNTGGMPTPPQQSINIDIQDTGLVQTVGQGVTIHRSLAPGEEYSIDEELVLQVSDNVIAGEKPSSERAELDFYAMLEGVNRSFAAVTAQATSFKVQSRVELADFRVEPIVHRGGEALLAVRVTNVGRSILTDQDHIALKVVLDPDHGDNEAVSFYAADGTRTSLQEGLVRQIVGLAPGASTTIAGTLRFDSLAVRGQSKVKIKAELSRGPEQHTIQRIRQTLQVADSYFPPQNGKILLVTDEHTSQTEIEAWQALFRDLGLEYGVWNSTLYGGMNLNQDTGGDHGSLLDQYRHGLVVFTHVKDSNNYKTNVPMAELYEAARAQQISCCIIGHNHKLPPNMARSDEVENGPTFAESEALIAYLAQNADVKHIPHLTVKHTFSVSPKKARKDAKQLYKELTAAFPQQQFTVDYAYNYDEKTVTLGVHRGMPNCQERMVAYGPWLEGQRPQNIRLDVNLYRMFKVMEMPLKVQLWATHRDHPDFAGPLEAAIRSDLATEYLSLFDSETYENRKTRKHEAIEQHLPLLRACIEGVTLYENAIGERARELLGGFVALLHKHKDEQRMLSKDKRSADHIGDEIAELLGDLLPEQIPQEAANIEAWTHPAGLHQEGQFLPTPGKVEYHPAYIDSKMSTTTRSFNRETSRDTFESTEARRSAIADFQQGLKEPRMHRVQRELDIR